LPSETQSEALGGEIWLKNIRDFRCKLLQINHNSPWSRIAEKPLKSQFRIIYIAEQIHFGRSPHFLADIIFRDSKVAEIALVILSCMMQV